ncbi:MAG: hypothetical protein ACOYMG_07225 [Candidatus Methylumidiphilus sp.]
MPAPSPRKVGQLIMLDMKLCANSGVVAACAVASEEVMLDRIRS